MWEEFPPISTAEWEAIWKLPDPESLRPPKR